MSYEKDWKAVVTELNSDSETGLSKDEAQKRLNIYGRNELVEKKKKSLISIIFNQLKELMVIILIIAAIISIIIVLIITYFIFMSSSIIIRVLGKKGMDAFTRVMGLLTVAIAVQFALTGIADWVSTI